MKRIAYSFLLIFLLSCGSSKESEQNRIKIAFRDSTIEDYTLLAVRDKALLVRPYVSRYVMRNPEVIPFAKIEKVSEDPNITTGGALAGSLIGCGVGATVGSGLGRDGYEKLGAMILLAPIGIIAGGIIGCNISVGEGEFDVSKEKDRLKLIPLSRYPDGEPPELEKIK